MAHLKCSTAVLLALAVLVVGSGCSPPRESGPVEEEPLVTEEVGGSIDADLSTDDDPRGPRHVGSSKNVLPPGYPVDIPLAAGATVAESGGAGGGESFVVFDVPDEPAALAAAWSSRLEAEGWRVTRVSDTHLTAVKEERSIRAIVAPLGSTSRLRVVYRVPESTR